MPIERIKITPEEFRATSANSEITFSSNNRYLKTLDTGTIRVGGYDRVPFIAGYEPTVDKLACGGFGIFPLYGYNNSIEFIIPFNNANLKVTASPNTGSTYPYSFNEANPATSPPSGASWYSGTKYYTIRKPNLDLVTKPFRLALSSASYSGDSFRMWPIDFDYSEAGVYNFPMTREEGPWYSSYDGTQATFFTVSSPFTWKAIAFFATQPSVNLALAVTP